jgi:hypothetical protein
LPDAVAVLRLVKSMGSSCVAVQARWSVVSSERAANEGAGGGQMIQLGVQPPQMRRRRCAARLNVMSGVQLAVSDVTRGKEFRLQAGHGEVNSLCSVNAHAHSL